MALLISLSVACGDAEQLEHERGQWNALVIRSYRFTYEGQGFDLRGPFSMVVTDGKPAAMSFTVEELFDKVRQNLREVKTIAYDERYHFPLSVYFDFGEEGGGWKITTFEAN